MHKKYRILYDNIGIQFIRFFYIPCNKKHYKKYEGWNVNSGNYLFSTDTK